MVIKQIMVDQGQLNIYCVFILLQNEVNDIPFFDIELPYELALKIFQYLNCTELGRCAQVSCSGQTIVDTGFAL